MIGAIACFTAFAFVAIARSRGKVKSSCVGAPGPHPILQGTLPDPHSKGIEMKKIMQVATLAAVAATASWAMRYWLERINAPLARPRRKAVEHWENEGGALAPQAAGIETSQVPR